MALGAIVPCAVDGCVVALWWITDGCLVGGCCVALLGFGFGFLVCLCDVRLVRWVLLGYYAGLI